MSDVRIQAPVVIREVLGERLARASLPNGKMITAYARSEDPLPDLKCGDARSVLLSLCDFSEGRLVPADQAPSPPPLPIGATTDS